MSDDFIKTFRDKARDHLPREVFDDIMRKARASAGGIARAQAMRKNKAPPTVAKGFISGEADGGTHVHAVVRNELMTRKDGAHRHLFVFPGGVKVWSEEDGQHQHPLPSEGSECVLELGMHRHRVIVPHAIVMPDGSTLKPGTELLTEEDGIHGHCAMLETTCFDGPHQHLLKLGGMVQVLSLNVSDMWDRFGPFNLTQIQDAPAASTIIMPRTENLQVLKDEPVRVYLGSGTTKPAGYIGVGKEEGDGIDVIADLEESLPFEDASVDEIMVAGTMEQLQNQDDLIEEIHRVLRPGGRFTLEVPAQGDDAWEQARVISWTDPAQLAERPGYELAGLEEFDREEKKYLRAQLMKPWPKRYSAEELQAMEDEKKKAEKALPPKVEAWIESIEAGDNADLLLLAAAIGAGITTKEDSSAETEKTSTMKVLKADGKKGIVYGEVLEADTVDAQNDVITAETIEDAAHDYLMKSRVIGLKHAGEAKEAHLVESLVVQKGDIYLGKKFEHVTWVIGVKLPPELQAAVEKGELNSFSIGGFGLRQPVV